DALGSIFRKLRLRKDPRCPVCGSSPTIRELIDYDAFCGIEPSPASLGAAFEIEPSALRVRFERGEPLTLIDVREPHEWEIARLEGAKLVPIATRPYRLGELNTADEIVAYCRTGSRSRKAVEILREAGFRKVKNLTGGIHAWADQVDPSVPKY